MTKRLQTTFKTKRAGDVGGFTLLELLISLVLGALLLGALAGVLRRSFAEIAIAHSDDPSVAHLSLLIEQFDRDMTNARYMRVGNNRLELVGFIHRDPITLIATHRTARVVYEVRRNGRQSMLVRIQRDDSRVQLTQDGTLVEPVYAGVGRLLVSSNQVGALSETDTIGLSSEDRASIVRQRDAVPSSVQIVMLDPRGRTLFNHTFSRQREG